MPLVSVVIPTYKHAGLVPETLASVFAQTLEDVEVIVVNDGSPDDTAAVLRPLAEAGRIRYVEQPNAGQAAARNRGIEMATGEFVALLDDDDLWPADKLAWQVALLRSRPEAVLCYGGYETFGTQAVPCWPDFDAPDGRVRDAFLTYNHIRSPGQTLIRAASLREVGGFDATIWGADDWDLYLRLAGRGEFAFAPRCALRYRAHDANASQDWRRMYVNARRVHRKHLRRLPTPGSARLWWAGRTFVQRFVSREFLDRARAAGSRGERAAAAAAVGSALRVRPSLALRRATWAAALPPPTRPRRLRVLAVAMTLPRPDHNAGDLRFVTLLEMAARGHDVSLCVLYGRTHGRDPTLPIGELRRTGRALRRAGVRVLPIGYKPFAAALARGEWDVVLFEFYTAAQGTLARLRREQPGAAAVVDSVDVHYARLAAGAALGVVDPAEAETVRREELAVYRAADRVIAVTDLDEAELASVGGVPPVDRVPLVLPTRPRAPGGRPAECLFVGGFSHAPNLDGLLWFLREVWPAVRAAVPGATLTVVGSKPPPAVRALDGRDGVRVAGFVPETAPYLDRAAVSVAPLRYGAGMKGKVTEAMASGVPVVTTTVGAQGLGAAPGRHLLVADAPADFARGVIDLLGDRERGERVGLAGQALAAALCGPAVVGEAFDRALRRAAADRPPRRPPLRPLRRLAAAAGVMASIPLLHWGWLALLGQARQGLGSLRGRN